MTIRDYAFDNEALGKLQGWEHRMQETWIAEKQELADDMLPATSDQAAAPRPNVVLSRLPATVSDPMQACREFLDQTAKALPGVENLTQARSGDVAEPFVFHDGTHGAFTEIKFVATAGVTLEQAHVFRIDQQILTQLVATYADHQSEAWRERMHAIVAGFRPG